MSGPHLESRADGLVLTDGTLELRGDFSRLLKRVRPDNLSHELLIRAARQKKSAARSNTARSSAVRSTSGAATPEQGSAALPTAVDATAGLGEDSFLLAAAGFSVLLFERDPVIAALLKDALARAQKDPALSAIAARMEFRQEDSLTALPSLPSPPDVIFLDPMFPERQKSALVKKKFQLLQGLEKPCTEADAAALLRAALAAKPKKIVVKRPRKGPYLAGVKPSYSVEGSTVRYDCILPLRSP